MLHLFKRIRRKLLVEKRLSNYIFYAIGEVLLVVIGILLAIQFSNLNLKKAEIEKEIWYLDNIANDMFNQKDGLLNLKDYYTETLGIAKDLLLDFKKNMSYSKIDSLSFKLNQLMGSDTYPNIDNTYRELLSSGQVSLIENDSLVLNIIDFYLFTDELENIYKVNQSQVFYGEVYSTLNKYSEVDISHFVEEENLLFEDKEAQKYILSELEKPNNRLALTNAIKTKILVISDYLLNVNESLNLVDKMINEIDDEIELLKE
ncbi:DUF6090 family protein [Polaribacter sp. MED152]|uniref:DUF6090 family protein n=1 Tax=Polaribacter sp. MED152 TaxID=313598 RepID=UPI000068CD53|nr:DUF6090 family protein [Polaribacter sp. MED152]EAQ41055.1 hypothetical protein MED152_00035 [Polaribacter sp. MED152]